MDAHNGDDVRQALKPISQVYQAAYSKRARNRPTRAFIVDTALAEARAERQIINAATGELVCAKVVSLVSKNLELTGSSVPIAEERAALEVKYAQYSPTLRLFLSSLDFWFSRGVAQVFDDDRKGRMPSAAIGEVAREMYPERTKRLDLWLRYSDSLEARQWLGEFEPTHEAETIKTFSDNTVIVAGLLLGRAVAHDNVGLQDVSKGEFASGQLSRIVDFSTVKRVISKPIMDTIIAEDSLLVQYSAWEEGRLDASEFKETNNVLTSPDAIYDLSLEEGAWDKAGYCGGNIPFVYPGRFPERPEGFLGRLGISAQSPQELTVTGIFAGTGLLIANETIYANWP